MDTFGLEALIQCPKQGLPPFFLQLSFLKKVEQVKTEGLKLVAPMDHGHLNQKSPKASSTADKSISTFNSRAG